MIQCFLLIILDTSDQSTEKISNITNKLFYIFNENGHGVYLLDLILTLIILTKGDAIQKLEILFDCLLVF